MQPPLTASTQVEPGAWVGFIGLGAMGYPMAMRLVRAGYRVSAWNRTRERALDLAREGAKAVTGPAEAARGAAAVVTMVADPTTLDAVINAPDGVIAGASATALVIDMSTVGPATVRRLGADMPRDVTLVDAPVLGSVEAAAAGQLEILVGANDAAFARCAPLLSVLGRPVRVGGPGSGAAAKLVANSALLCTLIVLGESLALGDTFGLDRDTIFRVLDATPLASQSARRRTTIDRGDYPPRFRLALARKDAELIVEAATSRGIDLRAATATLGWLADADDKGWSSTDYTGVLGHILRQRSPPTG